MFLFGVHNALTISYSYSPQHQYTDQSDSKDITGFQPAFIESDFMWYNAPKFKQWDIKAMKRTYSKEALLGYCIIYEDLIPKNFMPLVKIKRN